MKKASINVFSSIFVTALAFAAVGFANPSRVEAYTLPSDFCHTFNTDLYIGSTGADVLALNQILVSRDIIGENRLYVQPYDSTTAQAVSQFQEAFYSAVLAPSGLKSGNGRTGPATRAKLNDLYHCSSIMSTSVSYTNHGSEPTISNTGVSTPSVLSRNVDGDPVRAIAAFRFTIKNNWSEDMYIQKNPVQSIATVSNLDTAGAYVSSFYSTTDSNSDTSTYYYVPSGWSRQFQFVVTLDNAKNPNGSVYAYVKVPRILYSTTTPSTAGTVDRASVFTSNLVSSSIELAR